MNDIDPKKRPEQWLERKLETGTREVADYQRRLSAAVTEKPISALAAAFGVGYLARTLPVFSVGAIAARGAIHAAPYALALVGAARAYEFLRNRGTNPGSARPEISPSSHSMAPAKTTSSHELSPTV